MGTNRQRLIGDIADETLRVMLRACEYAYTFHEGACHCMQCIVNAAFDTVFAEELKPKQKEDHNE